MHYKIEKLDFFTKTIIIWENESDRLTGLRWAYTPNQKWGAESILNAS